MLMDVIDLHDSQGEPFRSGAVAYDPANPQRCKVVPAECELVDCREMVMDGGRQLSEPLSLTAMADYCAQQLRRLPEGSLRLVNPHRYKVGVSRRLLTLRDQLMVAAAE
jgi:nicotinate phosphoribosyltransferase